FDGRAILRADRNLGGRGNPSKADRRQFRRLRVQPLLRGTAQARNASPHGGSALGHPADALGTAGGVGYSGGATEKALACEYICRFRTEPERGRKTIAGSPE